MVAAAFIGGYLEVLENLVTALYSESRENDCFFPLRFLIRDLCYLFILWELKLEIK